MPVRAVRACECVRVCVCAYAVRMVRAKARGGVKVRSYSVHDAVSPQRTGCTVASPDADTELTLNDGLLTFSSRLRFGPTSSVTLARLHPAGARDIQDRTRTRTKPDDVWTEA